MPISFTGVGPDPQSLPWQPAAVQQGTSISFQSVKEDPGALGGGLPFDEPFALAGMVLLFLVLVGVLYAKFS